MILASSFPAQAKVKEKIKPPEIPSESDMNYSPLKDGKYRFHLRMYDYGIYEIVESEITDNMNNKHIYSRAELVEQTFNIPAELNTLLGMRLSVYVTSIPGGEVIKRTPLKFRLVITFPPRLDPNTGRVKQKYVLTPTINSGDSYSVAFWFKEEWELVPGEYNFKLFYLGEKYIDMTFNVHKGNE